jgi:hypothetical protein
MSEFRATHTRSHTRSHEIIRDRHGVGTGSARGRHGVGTGSARALQAAARLRQARRVCNRFSAYHTHLLQLRAEIDQHIRLLKKLCFMCLKLILRQRRSSHIQTRDGPKARHEVHDSNRVAGSMRTLKMQTPIRTLHLAGFCPCAHLCAADACAADACAGLKLDHVMRRRAVASLRSLDCPFCSSQRLACMIKLVLQRGSSVCILTLLPAGRA